jgi:PAS domain S-box-containing protein
MGRSPATTSAIAITRTRELYCVLALTVLAAALGQAVLGGWGPVIWCAVVSALILVDLSIHRALGDQSPTKDQFLGLIFWNYTLAMAYNVLPVMFWLHGHPETTAAAMVIWGACILRNAADLSESWGRSHGQAGGVDKPWLVNVAGMAPYVVSMIIMPFAEWISAPSAVAALPALGAFGYVVYAMQYWHGHLRTKGQLRNAVKKINREKTLARLAFTQSSISVALLDQQMRFLAVSRNWEASHGLSEAEVKGRHFYEVLKWTPSHWRDAHTRALAGETVRNDADHIMRYGNEVVLRWEVQPWREDDGRIGGLIIFGENITPLMDARREQELLMQRLQFAVEASRSVVWEVDMVRQELIGAAQLAKIFGDTPNLDDMFSMHSRFSFAEDRARVEQARDALLQSDQPIEIEYRFTHANGEVRWLRTSGRSIRSANGVVNRIVFMTADITARKDQELRLHEALRQAASVVAGKRMLVLQALDEFNGAEEVRTRLSASLAEEQTEATAHDSHDDMLQRLSGLLAEIDARDATLVEALEALGEARRSAEGANMAKSQFLANMSHELRTPLNAVIGYAEILEEDLQMQGQEESAADAVKIRSAARHLLTLINEILDLSKIEAGRMEVSPEEVDVTALVAEVVDTMRPMAERNGNRMTVDIAPDATAALTDSMKLRQCLLNLLSNACKFTSNGAIDVRVYRQRGQEGSRLAMEVRDTGIGISAEQQARLFQPFAQADAATTRKYGGTGLGLMISRRLAQLMGGDIVIDSVEGAGSTFTLTVALRFGEGDLEDNAEAPVGPVALIVDDEMSARDIARRSIERLDFAPRMAGTGFQGLALAKRSKPAIMILDINLPDISGWDVLARMKADPELRDVPVLIVSVEDVGRQAQEAGACAQLVKPVDRDVLSAAVLRFARYGEPDRPYSEETQMATRGRTYV